MERIKKAPEIEALFNFIVNYIISYCFLRCWYLQANHFPR